ncbi:MAG TPA: VTC domain-containing protein [Polyangia bacterium]|nr:VTC domain-containing protein [Polyangia bacterium]
MGGAGDDTATAVQQQPSGNDPFTHELRFLLTRGEAARFLEGAAGRASKTTYDPDRPISYTRTTYFDTADAAYLSSPAGEPARRLRVRQYASARAPGEAPVFSGVGYIELKQHLGTARSKVRMAATAGEIAALLRDPLAAVGAPVTSGRSPSPLQTLAQELAIDTMGPRLSTWYRRTCLTVAGQPLRITLDEGLQFCLPQPIGRAGRLATPHAREVVAAFPARILEVKHCGALPAWLDALLAGSRPVPAHFSKFRIGMEALAVENQTLARPAQADPVGPGLLMLPTIVAA